MVIYPLKTKTGYTTYFAGDHALFAEIQDGQRSGKDTDVKTANGVFDDKQNDRWF